MVSMEPEHVNNLLKLFFFFFKSLIFLFINDVDSLFSELCLQNIYSNSLFINYNNFPQKIVFISLMNFLYNDLHKREGLRLHYLEIMYYYLMYYFL